MKILIIGDLHGGFPKGIKEIVKKEKIDLILSTGDFADFDEYRKLLFKKKDISKSGSKIVKNALSKKEHKQMMEKVIQSMDKPLKGLDECGVPVYTIYGNLDYTNYEVNKHKVKTNSLNKWANKSKNIQVVREKVINIEDLQLLLFSGFRKNYLKFAKNKTKKITELNESWDRRLKKIFKQFDKDKTTLFLFHDPPKYTKLDLVNNIKSPMHGKHVGDETFRNYIQKFQPDLGICGHMHETQGIDKIGKTTIINTGFGREGEFLILDIKKNKIKHTLINDSTKL